MYKFSFKVRHKGCSETGLSIKFPKQHITVVDIQSTDPRVKQYLYYISGNSKKFDDMITYLQKSKTFKKAEEIERKGDTLILLVVLDQGGYVQNIIQKHNGFFIELHTVYKGYEFWHVGVLDRERIKPMKEELSKMGELHVISIGEVEFANTLLSTQQKKTIKYAEEQGYYETPRKINIAKIAKALKLNSATVGEHLMKAENKLVKAMLKRI